MVSGVDSIWFAEALIRLHAFLDGCWVRSALSGDIFDLCLVGLR